MHKIFFYGLFMDHSLLEEKGIHPKILGPAVLPGYRLHIGDRATLLPADSSRAFGIVMELSESEATTLYSEPSVREYRPEPVKVERLDTGEPIEVDCYNLPPELGLVGANPQYAAKLSRLAQSLNFDSAYVQEITEQGLPGTIPQ